MSETPVQQSIAAIVCARMLLSKFDLPWCQSSDSDGVTSIETPARHGQESGVSIDVTGVDGVMMLVRGEKLQLFEFDPREGLQWRWLEDELRNFLYTGPFIPTLPLL